MKNMNVTTFMLPQKLFHSRRKGGGYMFNLQTKNVYFADRNSLNLELIFYNDFTI